MDVTQEDLRELQARLLAASDAGRDPKVGDPLAALQRATEQVAQWFGGWFGLGAVYYKGFKTLEPNEQFKSGVRYNYDYDIEEEVWPSQSNWMTPSLLEVRIAVFREAGDSDIAAALAAQRNANEVYAAAKSEVLAILVQQLDLGVDTYLAGVKVAHR